MSTGFTQNINFGILFALALFSMLCTLALVTRQSNFIDTNEIFDATNNSKRIIFSYALAVCHTIFAVPTHTYLLLRLLLFFCIYFHSEKRMEKFKSAKILFIVSVIRFYLTLFEIRMQYMCRAVELQSVEKKKKKKTKPYRARRDGTYGHLS